MTLRESAATLVKVMRAMLEMHEKPTTTRAESDEASLSSFLELMRFKEEEVAPLHSKLVRGFYLSPDLRHLMNGVVLRIILGNVALSNLVRLTLYNDAGSKLFARMALHGTVGEVRHLSAPAEHGVASS